MESLPLPHVKHVSIREMNDKGTITKEACLATTYLMYAGSLANTRYIRIVNDANATVISVANEILNRVFIINPLRTTCPKTGSGLGQVKGYLLNLSNWACNSSDTETPFALAVLPALTNALFNSA